MPSSMACLPGSSPRMRGARLPDRRATLHGRIIPAYAGSTNPVLHYARRRRDHPRVCGEHLAKGSTACAAWGSSPRMRGALQDRCGQAGLLGIIPAYAGSTTGLRRNRSVERDHPRVCGEHSPGERSALHPRGSSPRMRGARYEPAERQRHEGIIPAYAGSTGLLDVIGALHEDHPRVCGEHQDLQMRIDYKVGSSPRMRGAQCHLGGGGNRGRIIPAYAGSTANVTIAIFSVRDHPRVCGEHLMEHTMCLR